MRRGPWARLSLHSPQLWVAPPRPRPVTLTGWVGPRGETLERVGPPPPREETHGMRVERGRGSSPKPVFLDVRSCFIPREMDRVRAPWRPLQPPAPPPASQAAAFSPSSPSRSRQPLLRKRLSLHRPGNPQGGGGRGRGRGRGQRPRPGREGAAGPSIAQGRRPRKGRASVYPAAGHAGRWLGHGRTDGQVGG